MADIVGTPGNDTLNGTAGGDTIAGWAGDDTINGGDGNDTLYGDEDAFSINGYSISGNDTLNGGLGNDFLYGGAGTDIMSGGPGSDVYGVHEITDVVTELPDEGVNDTVQSTISYTLPANVEDVILYRDNLTGTGNEFNNQLSSNGIGTTLYGLGGEDRLYGTNGNDILDGGSGNDFISSGLGVDILTGGPGNDTFRGSASEFNGDTITDFNSGDEIVFTPTAAGAFTVSLSNGTLAFTGGSMILTGASGTLIVSEVTGGGQTEVHVTLQAAAEPPFAAESLVLTAFGYSAGGWTSDDIYPRRMADVNGDGRADIVGFGNDGVFVALGSSGSFAPSIVASTNFGFSGTAGGWTSDNIYPRQLADVNGDNRADVVAFGEGCTYVALANANGTFGAPIVATGQFGRSAPAGGWTTDEGYHRELADVNGDGKADIVGFGNDGVYVALGQQNGTFAAAQVASFNFGVSSGAGGWTSDNIYPRRLADVNGDNRADIVAFGEGGTYVALGQADGSFGPAFVATGEFGRSAAAGGWTSNEVYYRELADVNGDNRADIVGFGLSGVYVALGQANGTFAASQVVSGNFGAGPEAGGWGSQTTFPRHVADVDNDGFADIIGFGASGVYVAFGNGDYWL